MSGHNLAHQAYDADLTLEDPGNGGTITAENRNLCLVELVTAAAETRTLADPLKSGIRLALTMKTDGGNCVVTATTAVNASGNTVLTFADAQDTIDLLSIPNGSSGYRWKVVGNDGVALS